MPFRRPICFGVLLLVAVLSLPVAAAQRPFVSSANSSGRYGSASFQIKVPASPKRAPAAHGTRPLYVSSSTKSLAISTDGSAPVVANVSPTTGYVKITIGGIPVGTHSFQVTAYDRLGGTGAVLSVGNTGPVDVPAGYIKLYLSLGGVVASLALVLDYPNPTLGVPAVMDLNVLAKDADGNLILSPGNSAEPFSRTFTLATSDARNGTLSQTTVGQNTDGTFRVSVAYSGAKVSKIVFSAMGGGLPSRAISPATLVPIAPPTSGNQLIAQQSSDPIDAFSTLEGHQFLGTIVSPPTQKVYASLVADEATRLMFIGDESYPNATIDIFETGGAHAMVGTIATPKTRFGGFAIDSAAGKLFSAQYGSNYSDIKIYSTAAGHALLGRIPFPIVYESPNLALDTTAGRLYAAGCPAEFFCSPGFEVFASTAPYKMLGTYGKGPYGSSYCSIAVDPARERLFLSECNLPNETPSYVDVYEAADLNHRAARIGPLTPGAQLAIDAKARVLYVTAQPGFTLDNAGYGYSVYAYGLDDGFLPLGSFPIRTVHFITVAPYAP